MRHDFCVFILTHGRPDRVYTVDTLKRGGYTGKVYIVIDDEDKTADEYRARYGDQVLQFSKTEIANTFDEGDNFEDRRTITYARNACFALAEQVGCRYFIELDDDYNSGFYLRYNARNRYGNTRRIAKSLDDILDAMLEFYIASGALTVALSQGGDHIGGGMGTVPRLTRKAMNSFICSTDRPFKFRGRFNEDVNTYTTLGRQGNLFFTVMQAQVNQLATQSNAGGITELYKKFGTYVKSMTTVCHCPSSVRVGVLGDNRSPHDRIHHRINWHHTAPKILREDHRKRTAISTA